MFTSDGLEIEDRLTVRLASLCLILACTGCLPSSCQRIESRDISPADSISRQLAAAVVSDTLESPLTLTGGLEQALAHPRTVLFGPDGLLYASDTEAARLFVYDRRGELQRSFTWDGAEVPYLAGWRGDSLVVFCPPANRIDILVDASLVRSVATPPVTRGTLQYAAATETGYAIKTVAQDTSHVVWSLDATGSVLGTVPLTGTSWEHAGLLRSHGASLFSLSGFYPHYIRWPNGLLQASENGHWNGFDSPMLRRTYAFSQGRHRGAPLLAPSGARTDSLWFLLNQRPGWIRIDVYDMTSRIQRVLVDRDPGYVKEFYPIDIAVQQRPDGSYDLVVAMLAPEPSLRWYTWTPDPPLWP